MKTIRHLATLVAVPFMLATSINANAAFEDITSIAFPAADMGFETEEASASNPSTGWWTNNTTYWSRSTEQAATGSASLRFSATDPSANSWSQVDVTIPEAGTYKIRLSIYIDASCNDGLSAIALQVKSPWSHTSVNLTGITKGEWAIIESNEMTVTEAVSTELLLNAQIGGTTGEVLYYIDDVQLMQYVEDAPSTSLFTNSDIAGFESSMTSNCLATGWWSTDGGTIWQRTTDQAHSGLASIRYEAADVSAVTNYGFQSAEATNPLVITEAGTYKAGFWIYIDDDASVNESLTSMLVILQGLEGLGTWLSNTCSLEGVTKGEWTYMEEEFEVSAAESVRFVMKVTSGNCASGGARFYVDDLTLEPVGDTTEEETTDPEITDPEPDVDEDEDADSDYKTVDAATFSSADMSFEAEDANASNPTTGWWASNSAYWSRSTEQAAVGSASLCYSGTNTSDSWVQATINIPEPGTYRYRMQVYVDESCNEGLSTIALQVKAPWEHNLVNIVATKGEWVTIESPDMILTEEEFQASADAGSITYTEGEPVTTVMNMKMFAVTGDVLFYIDDIKLLQYVDSVTTDPEDDDDTTVGIATTEAINVAVAAKDGTITIAGASNGTAVTVYAVTGAVVANTVVANGIVSVPAASGIYIVKVGTQVTKVAL